MTQTADEKPVVLVTGSSGRIGAEVVRDLASDAMVVGLDVKEPSERPPGTDWHCCDLTSERSVEEVFTAIGRKFEGRVASVVHLAAYDDFSGKPDPLHEELAAQGTRRLLEGLKPFERVEQLIFIGSLPVMKPVEDENRELPESSPTRTEWDDPRSKLEAERLLREERGALPVVVLRPAGVYDENCNAISLAEHIRRIYEKSFESLVFPGDAERGQPFVHLEDVAACVRAAIEGRSELTEWETFLIAEPEVMAYGEFQEELGVLIHGSEWSTIRVPQPLAKVGAKLKEMLGGEEDFIKPWMINLADGHYPAEIRRARERLQWEPRHRLRDALPAMIERLKRDPRRWYETNHLPVPEELKS